MKGSSIATGLLVLVLSSCRAAAQEEAHPPLPLENDRATQDDRVEEIPVEPNHQRQQQDENHIYQQQQEQQQEHQDEHKDDSLGHEQENTLENPTEKIAQEKPNVSHNEPREQQEQQRHQEEDRLNSHQQTDQPREYDEGIKDSLQQNENSPPMGEPITEHSVENDQARAAPQNPKTFDNSDHQHPKEPLFSSEKTSPFTAGQLRKLLQHLEDEEAAEAEQSRLKTSQEEGEETDDRTILDMFGEVTKEFLTQKVIPDTDPECSWDWRSLQCEPVCSCECRPQAGDFHVGRSCRLRNETVVGVFCQDPADVARQTWLPQRVGWMLRRTWKGTRRRVRRRVEHMVAMTALQLSTMQKNVCSELWDALYHQKKDGSLKCWPAAQVPVPTLPEKLFCGPIRFDICPE